jgi:hypothetical protein
MADEFKNFMKDQISNATVKINQSMDLLKQYIELGKTKMDLPVYILDDLYRLRQIISATLIALDYIINDIDQDFIFINYRDVLIKNGIFIDKFLS